MRRQRSSEEVDENVEEHQVRQCQLKLATPGCGSLIPAIKVEEDEDILLDNDSTSTLCKIL